MSKFGKTLKQAADKAGKQLDQNASNAIGLEKGVKISHAANVDSAHHKEAVKGIRGEDTSDKPEVKPEKSVDEKSSSSTYTASITLSSEPNDKDGTTHQLALTGESSHEGGDTGGNS